MGTRYTVTWLTSAQTPSPKAVRAGIEQVLEGVNRSMSTYMDDSEISAFNRAAADTWIEASTDLVAVFQLARTVSEATGGSYDVSVGPLVDLWGFGPQRGDTVPSADDISAARALVGQQYVEVHPDGNRLRKQRPLRLDFSSIAKGYAVDRIADWLAGRGVEQFLVEVGGEIRVRGLSPRGTPWRIAVEQPDPMRREMAAVLEISNTAVATSGDYRNFFEVDGQRYSHTIDPRTGSPIRHELVSVTVLLPSAAEADAWATALATLGTADALALAQQRDMPVYLISRDKEGFRVDKTAAIESFLK